MHTRTTELTMPAAVDHYWPSLEQPAGSAWFISVNLPMAAHQKLREYLTLQGIYFVSPRPDDQNPGDGCEMPKGWEGRVYIGMSTRNHKYLVDNFVNKLGRQVMAGEFGPVR
jgi:hypothetical protein